MQSLSYNKRSHHKSQFVLSVKIKHCPQGRHEVSARLNTLENAQIQTCISNKSTVVLNARLGPNLRTLSQILVLNVRIHLNASSSAFY